MKNLTRKILSLALGFSLFTGTLSIGNITSASESVKSTNILSLYSDGAVVPLENDYVLDNSKITLRNKLFSYEAGSVQETIYNGLINSEKSINIEKFHIEPTQIKQLYQDIVNNCGDLFYIGSSYSYYLSPDGTAISILEPTYKYSGSQLAQMMTVYNNGIKDITDKVNTSWSDLEKVVFVHDYITQNYEYDTDYKNYDAYSFFSTGKGVCQAYTAVFSSVMKKLGIDVSTASSDSMSHIWNVVKINGNWYHLDATWDDPVTDKFSLASHDYLLASDTKFATSDASSDRHYDWNCYYKCTDTKYDNYYWKTDNICSPYKYVNGSWYYLGYNGSDATTHLYSGNLADRGNSVYCFDKWYLYNQEGTYMLNAFSGLDVYNNTLYFNSNDTIYSYTASEGANAVATPSIEGNLLGLRINNGTLYCGVTQGYSGINSLISLKLSSDTNPDESPLGDVNFDGSVTLSDVTLILKAALNIVNFTTEQLSIADINGDNTLTLTDASLALKLALGISF